MKSIKFKLLIFIGITASIFSALLIYKTHNLVTSSIENLTRQELTLALDFNLAIREYVAETIHPLMFKLVDKGKFIPETMSSSFVARSIIEKFRKKFPNFAITFSAGNPRNPMKWRFIKRGWKMPSRRVKKSLEHWLKMQMTAY